jgi:hypothetical protein
MNKMRLLAAGIGAATPAFIAGTAAEAHSFAAASGQTAQSTLATAGLDQETLKSTLLQWTTAEKLRRAGDRIRLAKSTRQSGTTTGTQRASDSGGSGRMPSGCSKGISGCSGLLFV